MSRSVQPSRPSASTCCFLSSLKTFTSARDHGPVAFVNVLEICCYDWPVFRCPSLAGFGCPPRVSRPRLRDRSPVPIAAFLGLVDTHLAHAEHDPLKQRAHTHRVTR